MISSRSTDTKTLLVILIAVAVVALVHQAPNKMVTADPYGCLLTSQSLIKTGSFALDAYPEQANPKDYKFDTVNGHVYYMLSLGTAVVSVPAVWIANRFGLDMADKADEAALQTLLAALIVGGVFLLIVAIGRLLLGPFESIVFALIFTLGTSLSSTLGTAFWNQGFEVLAMLGAVHLVLRHRIRGGSPMPFRLGLLLGLAVFCRPTALLAAGVMLLYIILFSRRDIWKVLAGLLLWACVLLLISRLSLGAWLPPYYQAIHQQLAWHPGLVLMGLLFSPGRGLFIFSPVLLAFTLWPMLRMRRMREGPIALASVIWFLIHVFMISRHFHWWGGHGFGARLLTDAVPALVPAGLFVAVDIKRTIHTRSSRTLLAFLLALSLVGVLVHTVSGLYNPQAQVWNRKPNIDPSVRYVFDWRYPQPLASQRQLTDRLIDAFLPGMTPLSAGRASGTGDDYLRFVDWDRLAKTDSTAACRRSKSSKAAVAVCLAAVPRDSLMISLKLALCPAGRVRVSWNERPIGTVAVDSIPGVFDFTIPATALSESRHRGLRIDAISMIPRSMRVSPRGLVAQEIGLEALDGDSASRLYIHDFRWIGLESGPAVLK